MISIEMYDTPPLIPICMLLIRRVACTQVNNPDAHEFTTGPEIIQAVVSTPSTSSKPSSGKVDVLVAGAGTGRTITGISRAIKRTHNKECIVVGIDPVSCLLQTYTIYVLILR